MPTLSSHPSSSTLKMLLIGDSSSGKTGALASLAAAGYQLRIIDLDNGLDILRNYLTDPDSPYLKNNPDIVQNVRYVTLTEKMKNMGGKIVPASATVWQKTIGLLADWTETDPETKEVFKLGPITTWTSNDILIIDSLSFLSTAALYFNLQMQGALLATRTQNEGRRDIGMAQNLLRDFLAMLFDSSVKCNVIVISHITFVDEKGGQPGIDENSTPGSGYPSAIGRALSPHIPRYFNSVLIARTIGAGTTAKHKIYTGGQFINGQVVGAKTSAPLLVKAEYPLESGLADYFKAVKGQVLTKKP